MHIRQATIHDLEALVPLFDGYRVFYRQQPDIKGAYRFLKERFENNESIVYLAFAKLSLQDLHTNKQDSHPEGGQHSTPDTNTLDERLQPIGFTQLYPIFSSVSMERMYLLNDLYVVPEYRGKGVGNALIDIVKERCRNEGQKGIVLQTETTNPAQNLYERLGFTKDPDLHYFWATKEIKNLP